MKEAYKKTKLGWIPNEWKINNLNKIIYLNPESLSNSTDNNLIINYIDIESVKVGKVLGCKEFQFSEAPSRARRVIIKNDVIVSTVRPNLKSVAKINFDKENLICSTGFVVLRKKESVDSEYLFQFAMSDIFTKQLVDKTVGSNYPAVNSTDIKETLIIVPPLKEQQKIAEILSTVDSQIHDTDKLIEKTKELKKGLMQRLLTKGIGHTEFKMTETGEIPVEWEVIKIEEVCEIVDYRGKTPSKVENGIFLVTAKNIGKGYIDYSSSQEYIKEDDYSSVMSRGIPKIGDVLFTTEAPLGNVANVDRVNIALAQRVIKFRGNKEKVNNFYLKYYMLGETFQQNILNEATGSTVLGIKGSRLKKILLAIPSMEEQQQIVDILSSVDNQIEEFENKKIKLEELKKGLMQQLLTGKVRVRY
ncbi:MAG: restriction endonuclease subunit S [Clostridium sp.]